MAVALGQQLEFPGGVIGLDLRCRSLELGHRLLLAEQFQFQGLPLPAKGVFAEVAHQEAHGRGGEGDQGQHQGQGSPGAVVAGSHGDGGPHAGQPLDAGAQGSVPGDEPEEEQAQQEDQIYPYRPRQELPGPAVP